MTTNWLTDEQQRAWRGLVQMTAQLEARLNRELQDDFGLSLADYHVLVALSEAPDTRLRVFEIAEILDWEQSRLSHHLSRMQRRGLLDREPCRTDGRGAFVVLTDAGRAAIEQAAPTHVTTVRGLVFDGLSPDQLAALTAITAQVLERLHTHPPSPTSWPRKQRRRTHRPKPGRLTRTAQGCTAVSVLRMAKAVPALS